MSDLSLTFLGGAGTVTGPKTLLRVSGIQLLIDCGLFQGLKQLRLLNRELFSFDVSQLDAVLLTHAHLDHCGGLPLLLKQGYRGPIYCTPATAELSRILLLDSAKIQEEEAEQANREGYSKHHPALPLYSIKDAAEVLNLFVPVEAGSIKGAPYINYRFRPNGHIPGSSFIEIICGGKTIVFSGDIGRKNPVLLDPSEQPDKADILVLESSYGDRLHEASDPEAALATIVKQTISRGGNLLIPSFAVERAQEIMLILHRLKVKNLIPSVPMLVDSPMAAMATESLFRYPDAHSLTDDEINGIKSDFVLLHEHQSMFRVIKSTGSKIVIAGSGMLTGGRALEYIKTWAGEPANTILLSGFQAAGTRGRDLLRGEKSLKIHG